MVRLAAGELERVRAHARRAYPAECCGALLGRVGVDGAAREVVRSVPAVNARADEPGRFLIPAPAVRALEGEAAAAGLEVVGFYHSHPDGRPEPSALDLGQAWPWYSYVIVAVGGEGAGAARAWRLADDRANFLEEELEIVEEAG